MHPLILTNVTKYKWSQWCTPLACCAVCQENKLSPARALAPWQTQINDCALRYDTVRWELWFMQSAARGRTETLEPQHPQSPAASAWRQPCSFHNTRWILWSGMLMVKTRPLSLCPSSPLSQDASPPGSSSLSLISSTLAGASGLVHFSHSDRCEMVSHCGFCLVLYFPDNEWCGAFFIMCLFSTCRIFWRNVCSCLPPIPSLDTCFECRLP